MRRRSRRWKASPTVQLKLARDIEVFGSARPPIDVSGSSLGGDGLGVAD